MTIFMRTFRLGLLALALLAISGFLIWKYPLGNCFVGEFRVTRGTWLAKEQNAKPKRAVQGMPRYMTGTSQPMPDEFKIPNLPPTARQVSCFTKLTRATPMLELVQKCGMPDEHQGSGIYIFIYDMDDGSIVVVGTADLKRLLYVDHVESQKSVPLLTDEHSPKMQ